MQNNFNGYQPSGINETEKTFLEASAATAGQRIGASILDSIINGIFLLPVSVMLGQAIFDALESSTDITLSLNALLSGPKLIFVMIYTAALSFIFQLIIPLSTDGKTIGKAVVGLQVISDDGERASGSQLFIRSVIYTVFPLLGYISVVGVFVQPVSYIFWIISTVLLFTDVYHRALHDKWSRTIVIKSKVYDALKVNHLMKPKPLPIEDDEFRVRF